MKRLTLTCNEHTLLGIRVALSIVIAMLITSYWGLERAYWAIIAILSISSSIHLGDVVVRAWTRFFMTVIGFVLATILYRLYISQFSEVMLYICVIVVACCTAYFMVVSYFMGMLSNTFFVVLFFAALGDWSDHNLDVRIYETSLGILIALVFAFIIQPKLAERNIYRKILTLWQNHQDYLLSWEPNLETRVRKVQELRSQARQLQPMIQNSKRSLTNASLAKQGQYLVSQMDIVLTHYIYWFDTWERILFRAEESSDQRGINALKAMKEELVTVLQNHNQNFHLKELQLVKIPSAHYRVINHKYRSLIMSIIQLEQNIVAIEKRHA